MSSTATATCTWCGHVHEYPENAPDLGSCRPDGQLRPEEGGGRCECAGEDVMGPFPEPPRADMTFLEVCQHVVKEQTASSYNHVLVDHFSASAVVQIHDHLNETNRAKFVELINRRAAKSPAWAMDFVWKLVK